jgi:hypothetical protein
MPKRPRKKMYKWRITRIRSTPAALIGYVKAPDAEQAIKEAIGAFGIIDPEQQKRLAALPVKRSSDLDSSFVICSARAHGANCSKSSKSRGAATG